MVSLSFVIPLEVYSKNHIYFGPMSTDLARAFIVAKEELSWFVLGLIFKKETLGETLSSFLLETLLLPSSVKEQGLAI